MPSSLQSSPSNSSATNQNSDRSPNSGFVARFVPVLLTLAIVAVPLAFYGLEAEITRWRIASVANTVAEEGSEAGISRISTMIERDPNDPLLLAKRSELFALDGQLQKALEDSRQRIELELGDADLEQLSYMQLFDHIDLLTRTNDVTESKRFLAALEKKTGAILLDPKTDSDTLNMIRNAIAYYYSRIATDAEKLDEVSTMIDLACRNYLPEQGSNVLIAQVFALSDRHDRAIDVYSLVIEQAKNQYAEQRQRLAETGTDAMSFGVPIKGDHIGKLKSELKDFHVTVSNLRQVFNERADSYDKLGQAELASIDRDAARQLGDDSARQKVPFESMLSGLQTTQLNQNLLARLSSSSSYIDTRGCIRLRQGACAQALADFDYALLAMEAVEVAESLDRYHLKDHRPAAVSLEQRKQDMNRATMLYHRALTYRKLGKIPEAEKDEQAIRDLNIKVEPSLF